MIGLRGAAGRLPTGMVAVGVGIAASGLSAYGFLAVTARWLGPVRDGPLATFWSFTFLVGPGCFSSLEKEVGRLVSGHAAGSATPAGPPAQHRPGGPAGQHRPSGPVLRRAGVLAVALTGLLAVGALGAWGPLTAHLFGGSDALLVAFVVSLGTIAVQYLALGLLAGNARFGAYGVVAGTEGLLRLVGAVALVAVGITGLGGFGAVVALSPLVAVIVVWPSLRTCRTVGRDLGLLAMARSVSWLVLASLFTAVLVGSGPVTISILDGGRHPALTARVLSALVLVRVPLFLYTAAAATLLPALTRHLAVGDHGRFGATLRSMVGAVSVLGLACVVAAWTIGGPALTAVFGAGYRLPGPDLAILAAAAAFLLVATTLSIGLTAQGRSRRVALCWGAGVVALVIVTALVPDLLRRVEVGLLAGAAVAAAAMVPGLLWAGRPAVRAVARRPRGLGLPSADGQVATSSG